MTIEKFREPSDTESKTIASYYLDPCDELNEQDTRLRREVDRTIRSKTQMITRFKQRIWTCQDGSTVPVSNMTDRHLINSYRMLRRKGLVSRRVFELYLIDPGPNGEMAQDAFRQEVNEVLGCKISPWMDVFESELDKRGLKA